MFGIAWIMALFEGTVAFAAARAFRGPALWFATAHSRPVPGRRLAGEWSSKASLGVSAAGVRPRQLPCDVRGRPQGHHQHGRHRRGGNGDGRVDRLHAGLDSHASVVLFDEP
jgi:hypothetical protein